MWESAEPLSPCPRYRLWATSVSPWPGTVLPLHLAPMAKGGAVLLTPAASPKAPAHCEGFASTAGDLSNALVFGAGHPPLGAAPCVKRMRVAKCSFDIEALLLASAQRALPIYKRP